MAVTRFVLQPRWLAWHLLLVVVLVSFTWLGRWQLGSFEHKGAEVAPQDRATVALDRVSSPGGRLGRAEVGRRVRATGQFEPTGSRLVPGRPDPRGGASGYLVVTPLRTGSGVLPVVRGWVESRSSPAAEPPAGQVRVVGLLQASESGPPAGAPVVVGTGELPYVATVTLLDALPYRASELYDGYLALRSEQPSGSARPVPVTAVAASTAGGVGRWRNLAYALQWWLFAAAAVFFWWAVLRRAVQARREPDPESPQPGAGPPPLVAPRRRT
jgi:cytochrome oxidase assembly protein ShyY1